MRELREFREAFDGFEKAGIALAGVSTDTIESHRSWAERLSIPFPLLSDPERLSGHELGLVRRIGVADWSVELFRRATLLVGRDGLIAAAWADIKIRGHAKQVLEVAKALKT